MKYPTRISIVKNWGTNKSILGFHLVSTVLGAPLRTPPPGPFSPSYTCEGLDSLPFYFSSSPAEWENVRSHILQWPRFWGCYLILLHFLWAPIRLSLILSRKFWVVKILGPSKQLRMLSGKRCQGFPDLDNAEPVGLTSNPGLLYSLSFQPLSSPQGPR